MVWQIQLAGAHPLKPKDGACLRRPRCDEAGRRKAAAACMQRNASQIGGHESRAWAQRCAARWPCKQLSVGLLSACSRVACAACSLR